MSDRSPKLIPLDQEPHHQGVPACRCGQAARPAYQPLEPRAPTPCHPAPAGASAWGRPTRPTLPAWRRPCQGAPGGAHPRGGPALSGAGRPPARAAGHGQDGGRVASAAGAARGGLRLGNGRFHRMRPPTLSPPRHRPRSPPAHQRAVAAAWRSQRWPPDGGGWPCAAWVMGRRRRWGCGGD